jgi:Leucine-rich repeat (LRR) protein
MKTLLFAIAIAIPLSAAEWPESEGARLERAADGSVSAIDLTGSWITDAGLERLVTQFPNIGKLTLAHTRITDAGFQHLARLTRVRELDCYFAEFFTADALAHLGSWQRLERLNLRGTRVTSKAFEHIARLKALRDLDMAFSQIDDANLELLAGLPQLERLSLGGTPLTAAGLAQLRLCRALRHLDISGVQRVDSGEWGVALNLAALAEIGALHNLRSLYLAGATRTDAGADRPGLKESVRETIEGFDRLKGLSQLELLDISRLPVSASALEALSTLPKLTELRASLAPSLGERAVPVLLRFPALRKVRLEGSMPAEALERLRAARPELSVR